MEPLTLDTAFVTQGVAHVAFWNGRVLTAEDLRDEQVANLLGRNQLGRAIGSGIASGLAVRPAPSPTHVQVTAGIAVDRLGQVVELPLDVDLALVVPQETASGDGLFTVCDPVTSNTPTGTGLYLLVIRAAAATQSSAPGTGAFGSGTATECGPRYTVAGVSFRLIGLDPAALGGGAGHDSDDVDALDSIGTLTEHARARNILAHLFLDTVPWAQRFADPFGVAASEVEVGTLAALRAGELLPCEVPIALVTWSFGALGFVDPWAVRRAPSTEPAFSATQLLGTASREGLGRAGFGQFQDQLAAVLTGLNPAARLTFELGGRFRYLPAAGLIPIDRAGRPGFAPGVFGDIVVQGPTPIDPDLVRALLDESFHHAPIDLASGEVVFTYSVGVADSDVTDHLVFCTSRMEHLGDELVIEGVFPGGALVIGQQIEIRGRGFRFSTGDARVRFGDRPSNPLAGSTDTRLRVIVPATLVVDAGGSLVTLAVSSNSGTDSVPVVVGHPQQQPVGALHLEWVSITPPVAQIGDPLVVEYHLRSAVTPAVDVELRLGGTAAVVDASRLVDEAGVEITDAIRLDTDDEITIRVEISDVPDLENITLSLAAVVVGDEDIADVDMRVFDTGDLTLPGDPAITILTPPDVDVQGGGVAELAGATLSIADGTLVDLEFVLEVRQPGTYLVRVEPTASVGPWLSILSEPSSGMFANIAVGDFENGVATREITVTVGRDSAAVPEPSAITLVVARPFHLDDRRVTYQLEGA